MKVAVLPFNAAEGTKPAYGRQFAAFASEQLRAHAGAEINAVSYLTQIPEDGMIRMAFVNIADSLLPYDQLKDLFEQAEVEVVQDGLLKQEGDQFDLTLRFHEKGNESPILEETWVFGKEEIFDRLHLLVKRLADQAQVGLPEFLAGEKMEFGSDDPDAFLQFLEGYDALNYIQQANGAVAREFSPEGAIESLLASVEKDPDFEGPYQVLIQLARACAHYRIGTFEMLESALQRLAAVVPDEYGVYFGLGEIHQAVGDFGKAAEYYEKAVSIEANDPALYTRLGLAQMQSNMPVNAERNFRKAMEMEDENKPSADYLAMVLQQTGRAHEVPAIWKSIIDESPQNAQAHAKYAVSLVQAGKEEEGVQAFEHGLETVEETIVVKRYYAPYLTQKGDVDRAMDFYEDCIEYAPGDLQVRMEYVQALEAADRTVDIPNALREILGLNPDPNTRAMVLAKQIEIEQPKRAEHIEKARARMESGDFQGAIRELKPLRNWLADYWKMWALLSSAYNNVNEFAEAEDCARRLLELYPGCEPAYGEMVTALSGQGRTDEAYQFMRFAAANNPQSLPIFINLGLAAKRAGHDEEAKNLAKQIREAVGANEELEPILAEMEG